MRHDAEQLRGPAHRPHLRSRRHARRKLRKEFDKGGPQSFLKSLTEKDLLDAGIPKNQWDKVRTGDTDTIPWPTFPPNTKTWPPPGGGAFVIA